MNFLILIPVLLSSQLLTDDGCSCYALKYALVLPQYSFYDNITLLFRRVWLVASLHAPKPRRPQNIDRVRGHAEGVGEVR